MRKLISFMHISVDGFAGGPNGEMDWIHVDDEIFERAGYHTDNADAAIYGRITFEMMDAYWPTAGDQPDASRHDTQHSAWYKGVQKMVISKTLAGVQKPNTTIISDNIAGAVQNLKQKAGRNIILFGSPSVVHLLLNADLVDELWLFVNPVILGAGISFLQGVDHRVKLRLTSSHTYQSGVVGLQYERTA